jgi:hypothetical protein
MLHTVASTWQCWTPLQLNQLLLLLLLLLLLCQACKEGPRLLLHTPDMHTFPV